jgi:hypothetical protein
MPNQVMNRHNIKFLTIRVKLGIHWDTVRIFKISLLRKEVFERKKGKNYIYI